MSVNTHLFHLQVDPSVLTNGHKTEAQLTKLLESYIAPVSLVNSLSMSDGGYLILYSGARDSFVTVRYFVEGTVTINIEHFRKKGEDELLPEWNGTSYTEIHRRFGAVFPCEQYQRFTVIRRGAINRFIRTSDLRLMELDLDEILFEKNSPHQHILVADSFSLGKVLILDGDINFAVRDTGYTETLMQKEKENYRNKEILVLGGGNGALLHTLLKEKPKFVVVVEIDQVVIEVCRTYMKEANGGVLENLKGPNHEIIVGNCSDYLKKIVNEGKKFDYVFGDLTGIPRSTNDTEGATTWSSLKNIINLSFKILKPSGKYMCPGSGAARPDHAKIFENNLLLLDVPVTFTTAVAAIPSFSEFWKFYQIFRKNN